MGWEVRRPGRARDLEGVESGTVVREGSQPSRRVIERFEDVYVLNRSEKWFIRSRKRGSAKDGKERLVMNIDPEVEYSGNKCCLPFCPIVPN